MKLAERIELLTATGVAIESDLKSGRIDDLLAKVEAQNPWFVPRFTRCALEHVVDAYLDKAALKKWADMESIGEPNVQRTIGLIPAGNIPLVGLHDLIAVFITGHRSMIKPSSKDRVLADFIVATMKDLEPMVGKYIEMVERLQGFDAVIATGSNNTNRYFEHYFGKYPSLLRKNRTSVAILSGDDGPDVYKDLADDIFTYFGLGCRNISKVFVPTGFDVPNMLDAWKGFEWMEHHNKYHNNYMYQKSVQLVNKVSHYDTGYCLVLANDDLFSPIGTVYFEEYDAKDVLRAHLDAISNDIQVVVSNDFDGAVPIGTAQHPAIDDYADGMNTLAFLKDLE